MHVAYLDLFLELADLALHLDRHILRMFVVLGQGGVPVVDDAQFGQVQRRDLGYFADLLELRKDLIFFLNMSLQGKHFRFRLIRQCFHFIHFVPQMVCFV
jgi:hypothetical protein